MLADGHHRFETALAYRAERRAEGADDPGADAIMTYVVELLDDELCIEPIHRLIDGPGGLELRRNLADAFTITDKELLLAYLDAVFAQTKSYLSTVSNDDLNHVLDEPQYQPLPTLSIRLASVINCNTRHAGQIEYLRGLIKHQGWFPGENDRS